MSSAIRAARIEELTTAEFIRTAVADRVGEFTGTGRIDPVGSLRRALRRDFGSATDWLDLQRRLRAQNFVLRRVEEDLWLCTWPVERRLVPLQQLGTTEAELSLLYRNRFPVQVETSRPPPAALSADLVPGREDKPHRLTARHLKAVKHDPIDQPAPVRIAFASRRAA